MSWICFQIICEDDSMKKIETKLAIVDERCYWFIVVQVHHNGIPQFGGVLESTPNKIREWEKEGEREQVVLRYIWELSEMFIILIHAQLRQKDGMSGIFT